MKAIGCHQFISGIITVKSLISEHREYKIIQAIDPITAEKLSPETARKRGWLTDQGYKVEARVVPMEEAIEIGWVQVNWRALPLPNNMV